MCALMLRGAQTVGQLRQRTERLHPLADLAAVEEVLDGLIRRKLVGRVERRPGQKEQRCVQLLEGEGAQEGESPASSPHPMVGQRRSPAPAPLRGTGSPPEMPAAEEDRLGRLERELTELRVEIASLRENLGR
jgi:uncharacterized protein YceH (UPF0502 family)